MVRVSFRPRRIAIIMVVMIALTLTLATGLPSGAERAASTSDPALNAAPAAGASTSNAGAAYGPNNQDFRVTSTSFVSQSGDSQLNYQTFLFFDNPTGPGTVYDAQLELPAGALMKTLECTFNDTDASNDAIMTLWKNTYNVTTNARSNTSYASVATTGSGGYQTPTDDINQTVHFREGDLRVIWWLQLTIPVSSTLSFRDCNITWARQVSAAPGAATFSDVPTSNIYFKYIQALVASGITTGCGGSKYCPDAAVTRAQMATFLAKALGLHFPY